MTTSTVIPNAAVAVGAKPFASTMQALRDNIISGLECDVTAPVNRAAWHPYDMLVGNDGAIGRYYNGTVVASVATPTLEAGYDYLFRGTNLSHNNGAITTFRVNGVDILGTNISNATLLNFMFEMPNPASAGNHLRFLANNFWTAGASGGNFANALSTAGTGVTTSLTFSWAAGSFDAGQLFLYRRRSYMP